MNKVYAKYIEEFKQDEKTQGYFYAKDKLLNKLYGFEDRGEFTMEVLDEMLEKDKEIERLLKTQEMYEKKCNKIHQYITQNCEIIRHKDYDEVGKVNGGHILTLLNGGDEE